MGSRIIHIDIAKGICILLVVLGHNWIVLHDTGLLYRLIYSFHIPLFILLSGVFFNPSQSFWRIFSTRADALLKPYLVTLTGVALTLYITTRGALPPLDLVTAILYGTAAIRDWVPLWFLPHLFLLFLFAWMYIRLLRLEKLSPLFKAALLLATLAIGVLTLRWFWPTVLVRDGVLTNLRGLPLNADILLVTSFFFLLGYLLREQVKDSRSNLWLTLAASALFFGLHAATSYITDLDQRRYDNLVVSTLLALAGIYLVISLSKWLARFKLPTAILAYLGANSLVILIFHAAIERSLFRWLGEFSPRYFYNGVFAFAGSVLACLAIAEVIQRIPLLRILYLPRSRPAQLQGTAAAPEQGS